MWFFQDYYKSTAQDLAQAWEAKSELGFEISIRLSWGLAAELFHWLYADSIRSCNIAHALLVAKSVCNGAATRVQRKKEGVASSLPCWHML
jgi:hypothetical protein